MAAGYSRSFDLIGQGESQLSAAARYTLPIIKGYQGIKLNPILKSILLPVNTQVDLGGIAKGMTVDRAARLLKKDGYSNFMVSAGGDMYLSGNHNGTSSGWKVNVLNPISMEGNIAQVQVSNQAVATSAVTRRRWMINKEMKNHLIDPRSGDSVNNRLAAVTVVAPTTRLADVLAKTALILGLNEGQEFIEGQSGCSALFITKELELIPGKGFPIIKE
jgi:thiamine biosynthesis lipoprotein